MGSPGPTVRTRSTPGSPAAAGAQKAASRAGAGAAAPSRVGSPPGSAPGSAPSSVPGSPKRQDPANRYLGASDGRSSASMSRVSSAGDVGKRGEQDVGSPEPEKFDGEGRGLFKVIEQLAALEGALWSILDGLKSNATHCSFFCREYWGTSASHAQLSLERLACNERLKRQVQQACVLESLSLGVSAHLCSGVMQGVSVTVRSRLRNLLYYIHENCLVLLDLVCQRWLAENPHRPGDPQRVGHCPENLNLDILIRVKRYRRLRRGEHIMALRQHNEMIANVVRQLCRTGAAKQRPPLSSRGSASSPGDRSPGMGGGSQPNVLSAASEVLSSRIPLDRLRASAVRAKMLQYMRFRPLLNHDADPDCPWPHEDPYVRYGVEHFAQDGPTVWYEPLPPMLPNLEHNPKLPPPIGPEVYTLVLDLDETLVHYYEIDGVGNYEIRPGMHDFVKRMNQLGYEIAIFTAATQDYADWVIDQIDPERYIHHRLYRQHALPWGPIFVKDLSRIGRDLDRTMIIDNVQENFMLQPRNGIFICPWYDDPHDTALSALTPLLDELTQTRPKVHEILEKYKDQIPTWAGFDQFSQLAGEFSELEESPDHGLPPEPPPPPSVQHHLPAVQTPPAPEPVPARGAAGAGAVHGQEQYIQSARQEQPLSGRGAEVSPPSSPSPPSPPQPQPLTRGPQQLQPQTQPQAQHAAASTERRRQEREAEQSRQQQAQAHAQQRTPPQPQPQQLQQRHVLQQVPQQLQQQAPQRMKQQVQQHPQQIVARPPGQGDHAVGMAGAGSSGHLSPAGSHAPPAQPVVPAQPGAATPVYLVQRGAYPQQQHQMQAQQPARAPMHQQPQAAAAAVQLRPAFSGVSGPYQQAQQPQAQQPQVQQPPASAAAWGRPGMGPQQLPRRR